MLNRTPAARNPFAAFLAAFVALGLLGPTVARATATTASEPVTIEVLSNRADLISGGDALVQVNRPHGTAREKLTVTVGNRDVTNAFNSRGVGLVKDLRVGHNTLAATLADGRGARIVITNHPIGGPIFAGPQVQPWVCNTQNPPSNSGGSPTVAPVGLGPPTDAQCDTSNVTVDLEGARLNCHAKVDVTFDGPATVRLAGCDRAIQVGRRFV